MITSKLTQNFSFGKLRNQIDDILDELVHEVGGEVSDGMINAIKRGIKPPLAPYTLIKDAASPINRISDKPLMRTGNLLRSLKYDKSRKEIRMFAYGKLQNDGYKNPWKGFRPVPARPFIDLGIKDLKGLLKGMLVRYVRMALKK
jgi:hypothetical protein